MTQAETETPFQPYWQVKEVAVRLKLSDRFIYDLIASGELKAKRFGGRMGLRVTGESLAEYEARS